MRRSACCKWRWLAELMARKPVPLKAAGVSAYEARVAGFAVGMRAAGYTVEELRVASAEADELKAGGYTAGEMKAGGYTLGEMKAGGYTAADIKARGYSNGDLFDAGYRCIDTHTRENAISHCGSCTNSSCCSAANPFR